MTTAQKLAIRLSEIRSKLNELSGAETLTDEQRGEIDSLTAEYQNKEAQHRAAIVTEADETTRGRGRIRQCGRRAGRSPGATVAGRNP